VKCIAASPRGDHHHAVALPDEHDGPPPRQSGSTVQRARCRGVSGKCRLAQKQPAAEQHDPRRAAPPPTTCDPAAANFGPRRARKPGAALAAGLFERQTGPVLFQRTAIATRLAPAKPSWVCQLLLAARTKSVRRRQQFSGAGRLRFSITNVPHPNNRRME